MKPMFSTDFSYINSVQAALLCDFVSPTNNRITQKACSRVILFRIVKICISKVLCL